jgi:hypothetical protein
VDDAVVGDRERCGLDIFLHIRRREREAMRDLGEFGLV